MMVCAKCSFLASVGVIVDKVFRMFPVLLIFVFCSIFSAKHKINRKK